VANRAGLVIADEPTASLESAQGLAVIQLLRDYAHEQGRCVIVASHDLRLAECADTVHWLDDGCLRPWNGSAAAPGMLGASTRRRGSDLVRVSEVAAAGEVARS
jgi:ABC-type lipoprotein export system ATPase subunit